MVLSLFCCFIKMYSTGATFNRMGCFINRCFRMSALWLIDSDGKREVTLKMSGVEVLSYGHGS